MNTVARPSSHTRVPAASFSYGSSSQEGSHRAHPGVTRSIIPHALAGPLPFHRNASGPLSTARRERSGKPIMDWLAKKLGASKKTAIETETEEASKHSKHGATPRRRASSAMPTKPSSGLNVQPSSRGPPAISNIPERRTTTQAHAPAGEHAFATSFSRTQQYQQGGATPTFVTRSSASPDHSPSISRSPSEISLANSFLGIDDPDDRSFVPSAVAEDDASLRPIPPSHSSSPSRSALHSTTTNSQYRFRGGAAGHQGRRSSTSTMASSIRYAPSETPSRGWRSFASNGAVTSGTVSTKPTTVFSTDSGVQHHAHIAEVPMDVSSQGGHQTADAGPSHGFYPNSHPQPPGVYRTLTWDSNFSSSPLHPSPLGPAAHIVSTDPGMEATTPTSAQIPPPLSHSIHLHREDVQAPKHSQHHPRHNPRPEAQPQANASTVTLASSTFAMPSPGVPPSHRARSVAETTGSRRFSSQAAEDPLAEDAAERTDDVVDLSDAAAIPKAYSAVPHPPGSPSHALPTRRSLDLGTVLSNHNVDGNSVLDAGGTSLRGPASSYYFSGRYRPVDDDASVRALRRRGSWESGESKFSWAGGMPPTTSQAGVMDYEASGRSNHVVAREKGAADMAGVVISA